MTSKQDHAYLETYKPHMMRRKTVDKSVLELARERIRQAYKLFDTIVVGFSGGKDSTAVLNLTIEAARDLGKLPVRADFFDEEAIPYETEHYVRRTAARKEILLNWFSIPVKHRNACSRKSPYWYPWGEEARDLWVRPLPPESITCDKIEGWPMEVAKRYSMPDCTGLLFDPIEYGRVGFLMGIRADESMTRLRAVTRRTPDKRNYIKEISSPTSQGNMWKVYPIYDWRTPDVWTAPSEFGWDYNRAYDVMELAGLSHREQRCAPPYGEEPLANLNMFAKCFPDIWDKMAYRVPGAATGARYSQTELYSFRKKLDKPDDMGWQEWMLFWLERHPQKFRPIMVERLKRMVNDHYERTTEPILPTAKHPLTGISWQFLMNIAMRGDYKGRRTPTYDDVDKMRARYEREKAELESQRHP